MTAPFDGGAVTFPFRRFKIKSPQLVEVTDFAMESVGVTRLELATSRPPDAYSNQLSYTPSFSKAMQSYALF